MSDSRSSSCFSSLSFFLSFFPSPGVTLRKREIETGLTVFRTASQLRNDSDPLVAAPLEHRDAGLFRHPLCAPRCTVHVCHPAIRHASGFKCVLRSRVLIRVNVRYISTRCLHCAPVTKDIAIVYDVSRTSIFLRILKASGGERWACECGTTPKKKEEKNQQPTRNHSNHRSCLQKKTCLRARWMWLRRKKERKKLMIFVVARWPSGSVEEKRRKWNRHRLHGSQWTALRQIRINDQATFLSTSFCILIAHPRNMRRVTVGSGSERVSFIVDFDFASRDHMSKGGMAWTSVARLLEGRIPQFDSSVCN